MKTSRQRLLDYIRAHRYVTVAELSRVMRMTRANARHHLSILEQQGLVQVVGERPASQGRGRPALLYGLVETSQDHNLGDLAGILLALLAAGRSEEEYARLYQQVASALKSSSQPEARLQDEQSLRTASLTQRLSLAVQHLNQMKYQARWEAYAQGPRLILGHCPYAAILARHPEMCLIDRYLLQELTGAPVEQTEQLAMDERGVPFCRFALQAR